jgi:phosphoribosyl-ATP pyrophosphohydrolase/phosphoribosyl-AMP cyclohydrolase
MLAEPTYDERGLVPCIVQDATTGTVLMLAWMNAEALRLTRETRVVHFWSRSRQALWKKGETSGNTLAVVELRIDCDLDAVLVRAHPAGPTCHTGATSCFFHRDARSLDPAEAAASAEAAAGDDGHDEIDDGPALPILLRLGKIIDARRDATADKSYTKSLLDAGMPKILAKIAEEHGELAAELPAGDDAKVIHETADLLFHVMVGLAARRIPIDAVLAELGRRFGTSGHVEKARRA